MKLRRIHHQILQNFYLKGGKRKTKIHDGESTLIKGNGVIAILVNNSLILDRTRDSLVGRQSNIDKGVVKTTNTTKSIYDNGCEIHIMMVVRLW